MNIRIIDKILSKKCLWAIIFTCWFFIGIILSIFDSSLENNYVYVLGVNSLMFAQIATYHNLKKKENALSISISGVYIDRYPLFSILSKFGNYLQKWYSIIISLTIGIVYIMSLIVCVKFPSESFQSPRSIS